MQLFLQFVMTVLGVAVVFVLRDMLAPWLTVKREFRLKQLEQAYGPLANLALQLLQLRKAERELQSARTAAVERAQERNAFEAISNTSDDHERWSAHMTQRRRELQGKISEIVKDNYHLLEPSTVRILSYMYSHLDKETAAVQAGHQDLMEFLDLKISAVITIDHVFAPLAKDILAVHEILSKVVRTGWWGVRKLIKSLENRPQPKLTFLDEGPVDEM